MRNLKKTLCLVLALVFVLGLCTVGAVNGTDFSDQEEINYSTAVKAMSGLGILVGDDNDGDGKNEFRPTDGVTRAEAAKIIAYLVLGEEAEKWPARQAFDDVPADHWAARYIAYCQHNGIIAGYGNGKFGPNDPVTAAQFTKMLLASCGYNAKGEFEGAGWDQNVAKIAMQTKVLKNLVSVDWDKAATREETAQLAYNTMMNVVQVVVSKDTDSYVTLTINGNRNVTLAESTWNLITDEGVITLNKANSSTAKGTEIAAIDVNYPTPSYYVTEDDDNGDLLGHQVRILYRWEKINGVDTAVAYFIDDLSTEVSGMAADKIDNTALTTGVLAFDYGTVSGALAVPAKGGYARHLAGGAYVLDADGKLLSYKATGFFLATMTTTAGVNYVVEPYGGTTVKVAAPAGAKAGDILTVYKLGDVYTGKACTKQQKVQIKQSEKNTTGTQEFYNNKDIVPTEADNLALPVSINAYVGAIGSMIVGDSYTLYFDAEGGCYGWSDHVDGDADSISYVSFVCDYTQKDAYDTTVNYVQVINAEGKVENLKVAAATGLTMGDVCSVTTNAFGISTLTVETTKAAVTTYDPTNPTMDYSNATFVWYNGLTKGDLLALAGVYKPATSIPGPAAIIHYLYTTEVVGTVTLTRVKTVWFTAAAPAAAAANSYIYVTSSDVKEYKLTADVSVPYYYGYQDGTAMTDLRLAAPVAVDFYKYTKNATTGIYTLTAVAAGNGTATGTRNVYLQNQDTVNYILNGKLYAGNNNAIDLTNVKIVKVGAAAGPAYASINVSTAEALQAVLLTGKGVSIAFVENVVGLTHSVGGGTIYVTAFN